MIERYFNQPVSRRAVVRGGVGSAMRIGELNPLQSFASSLVRSAAEHFIKMATAPTPPNLTFNPDVVNKYKNVRRGVGNLPLGVRAELFKYRVGEMVDELTQENMPSQDATLLKRLAFLELKLYTSSNPQQQVELKTKVDSMYKLIGQLKDRQTAQGIFDLPWVTCTYFWKEVGSLPKAA